MATEGSTPDADTFGEAASFHPLIPRLVARLLVPVLSDISLLDFFAAGVDDPGRMSRDAPRRRSIPYGS